MKTKCKTPACNRLAAKTDQGDDYCCISCQIIHKYENIDPEIARGLRRDHEHGLACSKLYQIQERRRFYPTEDLNTGENHANNKL
jgi:hypothetical protein